MCCSGYIVKSKENADPPCAVSQLMPRITRGSKTNVLYIGNVNQWQKTGTFQDTYLKWQKLNLYLT